MNGFFFVLQLLCKYLTSLILPPPTPTRKYLCTEQKHKKKAVETKIAEELSALVFDCSEGEISNSAFCLFFPLYYFSVLDKTSSNNYPMMGPR
jgi:hypothetical protein